MALTRDCRALISDPTVPPEGHYSIYQVGSVCLWLYICADLQPTFCVLLETN
jgi:hypothetical protein